MKNVFFFHFLVTFWLIESLISANKRFSVDTNENDGKIHTWTDSQITATDLYIPKNIFRATPCALADVPRRNGSKTLSFLFFTVVRSQSLHPQISFFFALQFFLPCFLMALNSKTKSSGRRRASLVREANIWLYWFYARRSAARKAALLASRSRFPGWISANKAINNHKSWSTK